MSLPNERKMAFKNGDRIVHTDRNDGAASFFRDFKRAAVEGQQTQLFSSVAGSLGENSDRDSLFDIINSLKDGL